MVPGEACRCTRWGDPHSPSFGCAEVWLPDPCEIVGESRSSWVFPQGWILTAQAVEIPTTPMGTYDHPSVESVDGGGQHYGVKHQKLFIHLHVCMH